MTSITRIGITLQLPTGMAQMDRSRRVSTIYPTDQRPPWPASTHRLADPKEVAIDVPEPRGPLADAPLARVVPGDLGYATDRPQARKVVFLEHYPARPQPLHRRLDIFDLPAHLGVISRGGTGRLEERKLPAAAAVEQSSGPFLLRFETQLLRVEFSGPLQIPHRDPSRDFAIFEHHSCPPRLSRTSDYSSQSGLTSMLPNLATGCLDATSMASSRFSHSIMP